MSKRRTNAVGNPMLVELPSAEAREQLGWKDSGEGGLSFWLVVPCLPWDKRRMVCCNAGAYWPEQDVSFPNLGPMEVDAALLVGSTGESLYSEMMGGYFPLGGAGGMWPPPLTPNGMKLLAQLEEIYGEGTVVFVTQLDT